MLEKITLFTAMLFVAVYPLCFWISVDDPLKNKFHKFHLGLPNVVGGVLLVFVLIMDLPLSIKITVAAWKLLFFTISRLEWKKEYPRAWLVSVPSLIGMSAFYQLHNHYLPADWQNILMWLLGSVIFCSALYAMNLGHWYLNVHGLPIFHLMRATCVFWAAVGLRLLWDAAKLLSSTVVYRGDTVPLWKFTASMEGFLIAVGIFFGTLFPAITLYFAVETIKLKNTQSATGILYAILCAVLLGDITYKYFLIRYGIAL